MLGRPMLPHDRLLAWLALEDRDRQLQRFEAVFTSDVELDAQSAWDLLRPMLELTEAMRDVVPRMVQGDALQGAVVIDARDPVTDLWHREAWIFNAIDGLIRRVVLVTSQGSVEPPIRPASSRQP